MGARRFVTPFLMFVLGMIVTIQLILTITEGMPSIGLSSTLFPETLSTNLGTDIITIIIIAFPILFIEYFLFAVPIAVVLLVITKLIKSTRYELNIMNIGRDFGGTQLVRRAAAPALFSVASAELFRIPLRTILFGPDPVIPPEFATLFPVVVSLMSALIAVPIALLLFMPTWVLNDAGVVTHLKSDRLDLRQCPDTQGVGRWIANMLGGYALLAFPITMFLNHFYEPLILPWIEGSIFTPEQVLYQVTTGTLWTLGLPFFVMAFILPVIVFNEAMQKRSTVRILRLATRLGAKMVRKEQIQEIKRLSSVYDEEKSATVELYAAAANKEIVSTQKSIKTKGKTKIKTSDKTKRASAKQKNKEKSKKPKK